MDSKFDQSDQIDSTLVNYDLPADLSNIVVE